MNGYLQCHIIDIAGILLDLNENQANAVEENTESLLTSPRYFHSMFVPFAKTVGLRVGSVNPNEMNDDELAEYLLAPVIGY